MKTKFLLAGLVASGLCAPSFADDVFTDDVIIAGPSGGPGNLCVGADCVDGEIFNVGDGLIKMSANNNSIDFNDTSGSTFPDRNWRIQANEISGESSGEAFFIKDLDTGNNPFYIKGAAPDNALFVAVDGDIGMGTSLPQRDLHIVGESTPTVRLESVASPYTWDLGGNTSTFFIHDVVANTFPVYIGSGAPDASLIVASTGNLGLGTFTPTDALHVQKSDGSGAILIEETSAGTLGQMTLRNNGITFFTLEDTSIADTANSGRRWNFQNQAGTFRVTTAPGGAGEIEMILTPDGDLTIEGDFFSNSGTPVPDYVFAAGYDLRPLSDVQDFITTRGHLPDVPSAAQIAVDGHNVSKMQMTLLRKVEELTLYTLEQEQTIAAQASQLADMTDLAVRHDRQMEDLLARLAAVEAKPQD